jgi:hypothetical protein
MDFEMFSRIFGVVGEVHILAAGVRAMASFCVPLAGT